MRREMTPAERDALERLRVNRLDGLHFRGQQVIDGFIADFYHNSVGLVVEVDGGIHINHREYDAERDATVLSLGITVLRLSINEVVGSLEDFLECILSACRSD